MKCDIERWIDAEEDASIVFPEVEEQIPKKDAKKTISKNDKKTVMCITTNQNPSEFEQAKGEAKQLVKFFTERKWGDLCMNIDDNEINILTSILMKFISEENSNSTEENSGK